MIDDELNHKHANDPKVGDYWHEMFSPCFLVIDRSRFSVSFLHKTKEADAHHWTWDTSKIETVAIKDFANRVSYKSESMKDKTWCDVVPDWKHAETFIKKAFESAEGEGL